MRSDRIDQAPAKGSDHTEKVQVSHNKQGSNHTENAKECESSPSYETSPSDILDPRIERNARRELERDPDYIPEGDEVMNYSSIIKSF